MQVEIITEGSKFLSLERIWNPLLQKSGVDAVFLTFEWLSTWWRHFGQGNQLFVIIVKNQERIVGLVPFMITIREGFRQLTMIGGRTADYKDFIIAADENREAIIETICSAIVKERSWDFFQLNGFHEDSPNFYPLQAVLSRFQDYRPIWYEYDISPYVPISGSWDSYWNTLKSSFRKDSRRRMRLLNQEKGVVSYNRPADQREVDLYMEELIKQHIMHWKKTAQTYSMFENSAIAGFYKDLAKQLFTQKWLSLHALLANGEIAAIDFGFEYAGKYFSYISTFDHGFSKYSVGRLFFLYLVEDAFARGLREVDLLMGGEPYKLDFRARVRELYSIALFQRSFRGYASEKWFGAIRPRLEAVVQKSKHFQQVNSWLLRTGIRKK